MDLGYIPAALKILDIFHPVDKVNDEVLETVDWLRERITSAPEKQQFWYYLLTENSEKCKDIALKLASEGDTDAIESLRFCKVENEGIDFYDTAQFLAFEHFYRKGAKHLAEIIGRRLIRSIGCEFDFERIKGIYIDLMLNSNYDRAKLSAFAGAETGDLDAAESVCRQLISDGETCGYWRLILVALLSGDRARLESVFDEMNDKELALNIDKAYIAVRLSGKDD
jgi:hypothetical protein